ncbi:MAG: 4-alpha-glucanotransferase [Desulforhopalus sp.]|nr:4-alpha-glucanotransferase [Desulforhopalus sp.]
MQKKRSSGILAHITSLPSPFGIGDIGPSSYAFLDYLVDCGQSYWQFLPTGPVSEIFDNSPYMSTSAFAGSSLLISPELLFQEGLIARSDLDHVPSFSPYTTDFEKVRGYKDALLRQAFRNFKPFKTPGYESFINSNTWLNEYALFMTLKEIFNNSGWFQWPSQIASADRKSLKLLIDQHDEKINYYRFQQFEFFRQWQLLRQYAKQKQIFLIGDLPIYVSYDSADVWAHQAIFSLNRQTLRPINIAGVPPDYFSETGQRWGNPLYDWHARDIKVQEQLLNWWTARFSTLFELVDMTRIDHFRGFESFWAIPEEDATAMGGKWLKGPGADFFHQITKRLGPLNILAEDLGIITPEVEALRLELGYPGMKVLQFAFDGNPENSYLPYNFQSPECVVYTGTHDNDTTVGWYLSNAIPDSLRETIKRTANRSLHDATGVHHDFIFLAHSSIAILSILPLQDVLGFGNDCKMNTPGVPRGNWRWRCAKEFLTSNTAEYLKNSTNLFGRGRHLRPIC